MRTSCLVLICALAFVPIPATRQAARGAQADSTRRANAAAASRASTTAGAIS